MQHTYEIRLLNESGEITVFYAAQCANDEQAHEHIRRMNGKHYARYELWRDGSKVGEGHKPAIGAQL